MKRIRLTPERVADMFEAVADSSGEAAVDHIESRVHVPGILAIIISEALAVHGYTIFQTLFDTDWEEVARIIGRRHPQVEAEVQMEIERLFRPLEAEVN